jgi:hypothetical protein
MPSRWVLIGLISVIALWLVASSYWPGLKFGRGRRDMALILGLGAPYVLATLWVGWRLSRLAFQRPVRYHADRDCQDTLFVFVWVLLEVAAYFALTPFPAVRRVIPLTVPLAILGGRLVATNLKFDRSAASGLWGLAGVSVFLGLLCAGVDLAESVAIRRLPLEAARWIRHREPEAKLWCAGHWGFQFYAELEGMQEIIPGRSLLHAGDWVVLPARIHSQVVSLGPGPVRIERVLRVGDRLPFSTVAHFYNRAVAIQGWDPKNPRFSVQIIKVIEDFVAP